MHSIARQASSIHSFLLTHGSDMQSWLFMSIPGCLFLSQAVYVHPSGAKQTSFKEGIGNRTYETEKIAT